LGTGRIDLTLWSREPTIKILRGGRRKGKLGLPLWTGKASGAWTKNFMRQLPCSKKARAGRIHSLFAPGPIRSQQRIGQ